MNKYAVAWMFKSKGKLVADVVGHVPQEISRFVYFFLTHGGSAKAEKYQSLKASTTSTVLTFTCGFNMIVFFKLFTMYSKQVQVRIHEMELVSEIS